MPKYYKLPFLYIVFCISSIMCSCSQHVEEHLSVVYYPSGPSYLLIIKFQKPEYSDYIFTRNNNTSYGIIANDVYSANAISSATYFQLQGKRPYYDLLDDYILMDWKWQACINHRLGKNIIIEKYWKDYSNLAYLWDTTVKHIEYPIMSYYRIPIYIVENEIDSIDRHYFSDWSNIVDNVYDDPFYYVFLGSAPIHDNISKQTKYRQLANQIDSLYRNVYINVVNNWIMKDSIPQENYMAQWDR